MKKYNEFSEKIIWFREIYMVGIFLIDGRETSTSITRIAGVKMAVKLFRRNVRTKNRSNLYLSARLKRFS